MKKKVNVEIENIDFDFLEGSIQKVTSKLSQLQRKYEALGYEDLKIDIVTDWGGTNILLYGDRIETDEEYSKRIDLENKKILKIKLKEERERQKYEKLKTKYEQNK